MLVGSLLITAWRVLGLRMDELPLAMEGSCEYIEKTRGQTTTGGPAIWGLGVGLISSHLKNNILTKIHTDPRTWTDSLNKRLK
jgi:hypothetical protein